MFRVFAGKNPQTTHHHSPTLQPLLPSMLTPLTTVAKKQSNFKEIKLMKSLEKEIKESDNDLRKG